MPKTDQPQSPTSRASDAIIRAIESHFESGVPALEFVRRLAAEPEREALLHDLIAACVPDRPDAVRWMAWLRGGPAPAHEADPDEEFEVYDGLKHPRVRRSQSAGRLAVEQDRKVGELDQKIEQKREDLVKLERKRDHHDGLRRAAVAYALMDRLARQLDLVFALGPAFTLMRAVSPKATLERCFGDNSQPELVRAAAYMDLAPTAAAMRRTLADLVGDAAFEADLFEAIRVVTDKHRPRAATLTTEQKKRRRLVAEGELGVLIDGRGRPDAIAVDERPFDLDVEEPPAARLAENEKPFEL